MREREREIDIEKESKIDRGIDRERERQREIGIVKLNYINIDIVKLKNMGASKGQDRIV